MQPFQEAGMDGLMVYMPVPLEDKQRFVFRPFKVDLVSYTAWATNLRQYSSYEDEQMVLQDVRRFSQYISKLQLTFQILCC